MLPLTALLLIIVSYWGQFLALFGLGTEAAPIQLKQPPLHWLYVSVILVLVLVFEVLPYMEEFWRGVRQNRRRHL
jgi:ABC-type spermidine/putrescine transport system permease subunit I